MTFIRLGSPPGDNIISSSSRRGGVACSGGAGSRTVRRAITCRVGNYYNYRGVGPRGY